MSIYVIVAAIIAASCTPNRNRFDTSTLTAELNELDVPIQLGKDEGVLYVVGTNDIHGSMVASHLGAVKFGSFANFVDQVDAMRSFVTKTYGEKGKVVLLDAGDAVQGSLLSNFDEGQTLVKLMNIAKYDAAVLGNHGFDFGPPGWTVDTCSTQAGACDPRGALRAFVSTAAFPFLGANVYKDKNVAQPLTAFHTIEFMGRKIVIVGLENLRTRSTTIAENVADLEFTSGEEELKALSKAQIETGKADMLLVTAHEGDGVGTAHELRDFLTKLPRRSDGAPLVDAYVAGHTHNLNESIVEDVPYIQSRANGQLFGIIRLVVKKSDNGRLQTVRTRTKLKAGIPISVTGKPFFQRVISPNKDAAKAIEDARIKVAPIAEEHLANVTEKITREGNRDSDSETGNLIADGMREMSKTTIALINSGDIRDDIKAGPFKFVDLANVIPKNLRIEIVESMPTELIALNLAKSVRTCGIRGAMQVSGFKVTFSRSCVGNEGREDKQARLLKMELIDGTVIWENLEKRDILKEGDCNRCIKKDTTSTAVSDFVLGGGAGYTFFKGVKPTRPSLELRRSVADFIKKRQSISGKDFARGRYINLTP